MQQDRSAEYLEFLSPDEIRIKGHRIWLEHIVARARQGMSAPDIEADLPTLTVEEVQAVLTYSETHGSEVDAYMARHAAFVAEQERHADHAPVPPVIARLRRLRDRFKAQGAQEAGTRSADA